MAVTRDDVLRVATLARLALDEARIPALVAELNGILAHMEELSAADTTGVCGISGVGDAGLPLREDSGPQLSLATSRESFAPAMRDSFFLVPRLATHGDSADEVP
ncbi:MAG: Asp-tRNA(Asn)/Glu-tRNA(Gln) amidotransferase subunit GatC [Gemmatimonadaceae bacterium]